MTTCLIEYFSTLKDPRIERNKLHSLLDIGSNKERDQRLS